MNKPENSSFNLACSLWLVTAALLFGLYIAGLPTTYQYILDNPTEGSMVDDPAAVQALMQELGLSPGLYAALTLLERMVGAPPIAVIGLILFAQRVWPGRRGREKPWGLWGLSLLFVWIGTGGGNSYGGFEFIPFAQPALAALVRFFALLSAAAWPALFYTFPDGRFTPRWTRWIAVLFLGLMAIPIYSPDLWARFTDSVLVLLPLLLTFIYAPVARYRQAEPSQRLQMRWGVWGLAAVPLAWLLSYVVPAALPTLFQPTAAGFRNELLFRIFLDALYLMPAVGLGVAVLSSRLWDIDVIIRKTLVYSLLTSLLALVYLGSVVLLQAIFGRTAGAQSPLVIVLSTLLIAALFSPLRRRVQAIIDRRFFRQKYDAQQVLAQFAQTARDEVDIETLKAQLMSVVSDAMQPESVGLWIEDSP